MDMASNLLCAIWNEAEILDYNLAIGAEEMPTVGGNVTCPHEENDVSSVLLCEAWCRLKALQGHSCVSCPEEFTSDPASDLLCPLWEELVDLGGPVSQAGDSEDGENSNPDGSSVTDGNEPPPEGGISPGANPPIQPVKCLHEEHSTSSDALCELWCAVHEHKGEKCLECPTQYQKDIESDKLCDLWSEAEILQHAQETCFEVSTKRPTSEEPNHNKKIKATHQVPKATQG